jgi:hypothetical protein
MNTQEKCQCLVCYKPSSKSMKWAVLGGRQGDLRFSSEALKLQFDTLPGDPRSPRPSGLDIMPPGSGVCLGCYENPNSGFSENLLDIGACTEQGCLRGADPRSEPCRGHPDYDKLPKNKTRLWPRTPSGWKLVVVQRAFSNEICMNMIHGEKLSGKSVSWFSENTGGFVNGQIKSYSIKSRICKVTSGGNIDNICFSLLYPPNATQQCTERCFCPGCVKPKCCIVCQKTCLSGTEGPGYNWYCRYHPVEKFFVPGSANQYEISAWMYEDNHKRGETMSVIDLESSIGIALYGKEREVVLASCEGVSISTTVNVEPKPPKKDMCHECKKETYHGRICPSTGDSNWYCNGCWDKYWVAQAAKKKQEEDFPALS